MKVKVTINRGGRNSMSVFHGKIIGESTTHYLIVHETNESRGEWISKESQAVSISKSEDT